MMKKIVRLITYFTIFNIIYARYSVNRICPSGTTLDLLDQTCKDINECDITNVCGRNQICFNVYGTYLCLCPSGYTSNGTIHDICKNECEDIPCHEHAVCKNRSGNDYKCECKTGYAGNGQFCDLDSDNDGWPDSQLNCTDFHCHNDNCINVPNSGQEDIDGDGVGDECDQDADNDSILNDHDNCKYHSNVDQIDNDRDSHGNACDNCPSHYNVNQIDTDSDGFGDACDGDIDNDGILNENDNCPKHTNPNQLDSDGDGIGDACDNCVRDKNPRQKDMDQDFVGDVCDKNIDLDKDGIDDSVDNCPKIYNPDQLDTDDDGIGDMCDEDKDNDGIFNDVDNCPLAKNPDQLDANDDDIGDYCEEDFDDDKIPNILDNCPYNSKIFSTDFRRYSTIALDPEGMSQVDPVWIIKNNGSEIHQTENSDPGIAVGDAFFGGVDFEGTFFVSKNVDDDWIGFVFSLQNNQQFYSVMWKNADQSYWEHEPFTAIGTTGIQLKLINSQTGPGEMLRNSLWHTGNTTNQVTLLWNDNKNNGWKWDTSYRWELIHRPVIGLIRFKIYEGTKLITDSGNVYDSTLKGGRLGVYCFSQELITWSHLIYKCNDKVPEYAYNDLHYSLIKQVEIDED